VARILQSVVEGYRFERRIAGYWRSAGKAGLTRPRLPRRYGYARHESRTRYSAIIASYPVALAAWLQGASRQERPEAIASTALGDGGHAETIIHLPILGVQECAATCERIHGLNRLWINRQPGFFTLGRAAYMDCRSAEDRYRYFNEVGELNNALRDNFQPLYAGVGGALQQALGAPCRLMEDRAIPGFHIWRGAGIPRFGFDAGSVHFDLQYLDVGLHDGEWPGAGDVISFTLPLRLPKAGGGLNIWDIHYPEPAGWEVRPYKDVSRVNYTVGSLVLHTGHELHQIAPVEQVEDQDERICLQGHGVHRDGCWWLYW
jgi:hypothetical protein